MLKLRTMVDGAEQLGAGLAVDQGDARITRVGALLRRTSVDELPNLVNVLRGEMSIVGPRPTLPSQVALYTERELGRLAVRPGITGWAQVNGRASLPWSERIELDLWYIEHRSWRLDLKILARSVRMVFAGEDLYRGETRRLARALRARRSAMFSLQALLERVERGRAARRCAPRAPARTGSPRSIASARSRACSIARASSSELITTPIRMLKIRNAAISA